MTVVGGLDRPGLAAAPAAARRRWTILVVVSIAQFLCAMDATIVNVALPSIARDMQMSATDLQWVVSAYSLIFGGFLLLGGRLSDLTGRRRILQAGLVVVTVASVISALSRSTGMLIAGRGLQGLGAALISPAALTILNTSYQDPQDRTKALGVWGAIAAGGSALGLVLGGVLAGSFSWAWIFAINVPLAAGVLLFGLRVVPESRAVDAVGGFDVAGAITVTSGLVLAVFTLVNGEKWRWASLRTVGFAAAAVVLLIAFALIERRSRAPLVRLGIFKLRALTVANAALVFLTSGMFGMFFFSALYLQGALGYRPLTGGLTFVPGALGVMVGAGLSDKLVRRLGHVGVGALGLALGAAGMIFLARLPVAGSYLVDFLPGLVPLSIGLGVAYVPITFLATGGVPAADAGLASGIYQTVQQVGGAIGLAILSTLAAARTEARLAGPTPDSILSANVAGYRLAFAAGALLLLLGGITFTALLRRHHLVQGRS